MPCGDARVSPTQSMGSSPARPPRPCAPPRPRRPRRRRRRSSARRASSVRRVRASSADVSPVNAPSGRRACLRADPNPSGAACDIREQYLRRNSSTRTRSTAAPSAATNSRANAREPFIFQLAATMGVGMTVPRRTEEQIGRPPAKGAYAGRAPRPHKRGDCGLQPIWAPTTSRWRGWRSMSGPSRPRPSPGRGSVPEGRTSTRPPRRAAFDARSPHDARTRGNGLRRPDVDQHLRKRSSSARAWRGFPALDERTAPGAETMPSPVECTSRQRMAGRFATERHPRDSTRQGRSDRRPSRERSRLFPERRFHAEIRHDRADDAATGRRPAGVGDVEQFVSVDDVALGVDHDHAIAVAVEAIPVGAFDHALGKCRRRGTYALVDVEAVRRARPSR